MAKSYKKRHRQYLLRKDLRQSRRGIIRVLFGVACALIFLLLWNLFGTYFDTKLQRFIYSFVDNDRKVPDELFILSIDDKSYAKLGLSPRQPFSRKAFAQALLTAQKLGPKVAILDLYMAPESQDPEANELLVQALEAGPTTISFADAFQELSDEELEQIQNRERNAIDFSGVRIESDPRFVNAAAQQVQMVFRLVGGQVQEISAGRILRPEIERLAALKEAGEKNPEESLESRLSRLPLMEPLIKFAGIRPHSPDERALIHYYGPPGTIPSASLYKFMPDYEGERPDIKGKVLFVGFQSFLKERGQALKDQFATPVSSREMYGVEVHATIAGNLIDGSFIRRLERESGTITNEFNILFALVFIFSYVTALFRPLGATLFSSFSVAVWLAVSAYLFKEYNLFLPGVLLYFLLAPFIIAASAIVAWLQVERSLSTAEKRLGKDLRGER